MKRFLSIFRAFFFSCLLILVTATSVWQPKESVDRVRVYTRNFEFDYFRWTLDAFWTKVSTASISPAMYLNQAQQRKVLKDYFQALTDARDLEDSLEMLYADPLSNIAAGDKTALEKELKQKKASLKNLGVLAEAVIQDQISQSLDELGLAKLNQPIPPVLYHASDLPKNLVISPRDVIRQESSISLTAEIALTDEVAIETAVEENTGYSALVVSIGGVGTYPTMVIQSGNLSALLDTVAHEWTHNYLTLRPLGMLYDATPELRTMNETTASIVGGEIGAHVLQRDYSDLFAASSSDIAFIAFRPAIARNHDQAPPLFDFRAEMRETRITVDALLAEGKIEAAEAYMEARRQVFWQNGYTLRRLNQAYFAFYGAYADTPGGAAGEDPVGPAVRALRAQSVSLADFVNRISWMTSFNQLQRALEATEQ